MLGILAVIWMVRVHISDASAGKSTRGKEMVSKTTVWRKKEERLGGSFNALPETWRREVRVRKGPEPDKQVLFQCPFEGKNIQILFLKD